MNSKKNNLIFSTLLCGAIVTSLLQTALTTALPNIMKELQLTAATAQWLTSAFSLTMAVMIPATAFLIKRFSTRQIFISAMTFFTVGTLISWLAKNFGILLIGRIFQALGSGIILPLTQVAVMTMYPVEKQGTIMGVFGLATGAAPVIAPTLTGIAIDLWNWRSIFLISLILAASTLILSLFTIKNVTPTEKIKFDLWSMILCTVGLSGILIGLSNLTSDNFAKAVIPLIIGIISLIIFSKRQLNLKSPFLELKTLKTKNFRVAVIISILLYAVMMGGSTVYPILIQSVMKKSAMISALVMLPGSLAMALINPFTGRFFDRFGINKLVIGGSILMFISCLGVSFVSSFTPIGLLIVFYLMRLLAIGCIMMPIVTWGMQNLPSEQVAHGTALLTALRTVSGAFGTAISMEIMTEISAPKPVNYAGVRVAFVTITIIALIQLIISLINFRTIKREPYENTKEK
ncbi:MDR family MFS transporter [Xylocopilactobacillus apis]|uniref:MFS transporter n=1 Tax=Xylocopilactobacillus apis TaxID=2932183 RepID=A0AAU9D3M2_9LACO|nr:MDR family MFS transporter [Xylocopilactobacillus apis]BDR56005.1 MFS transporter [Xylocopilactobacillus apis]